MADDPKRASMGEIDFEIAATVHDIVANDDHVVLLADATAKPHGRTLTSRVAEIHHVRDGQITERWAFSDDTAAIGESFAWTLASTARPFARLPTQEATAEPAPSPGRR